MLKIEHLTKTFRRQARRAACLHIRPGELSPLSATTARARPLLKMLLRYPAI